MEEKPLSTSHQALPVRQHQALPVQHQVLRSSFFVLISALHGLAAAAVVCFMRTGGPAATLATCRRIIALSVCASCIRLLKLILSACLATPAPGPASALDFEEYIAQVCREYPDIYERAKADALNRNPFGGDAITAPAAPAADAFSGEQPAPSSASAAAGAPSAPDAEDVWCLDDEEVIETRWDRR